jgi:hypothetical protein
MFPPSPILADALGFFLGLIFLLLLGVAIVSSLQRKQEAEHRRRIRAELERQGQLPPPPRGERTGWPVLREVTPPSRRPQRALQTSSPRRRTATLPITPPRRAVPPLPAPRRKTKANRPPAAPTRAAQAPVETHRPPSSQTTPEIRSAAPLPGAVRRAPAANAATRASWLKPNTLQSQFILTEILQPPLALRDNHLQ